MDGRAPRSACAPARPVARPSRRVARSSSRRRSTRTVTPARAGGEKAPRGRRRPSIASYSTSHRPAPPPAPLAHRRATWYGTTRSALTSCEPRAVRRRSSAAVTANGGFATTRNGRRGSRRSAASATTTTTSDRSNRERRDAARPSCSSTATTCAPTSTSRLVIEPAPAPTSTTRSPLTMPASATSVAAHALSSWWYPHRGGAATEDHDHCHGVIVAGLLDLCRPTWVRQRRPATVASRRSCGQLEPCWRSRHSSSSVRARSANDDAAQVDSSRSSHSEASWAIA